MKRQHAPPTGIRTPSFTSVRTLTSPRVPGYLDHVDRPLWWPVGTPLPPHLGVVAQFHGASEPLSTAAIPLPTLIVGWMTEHSQRCGLSAERLRGMRRSLISEHQKQAFATAEVKDDQ